MSWLARSIANTLRLDDDDDEEEDGAHDVDRPKNEIVNNHPPESSSQYADQFGDDGEFEDVHLEDPLSVIKDDIDGEGGDLDSDSDAYSNKEGGRGVKEDLSEFRETLTRQLWGVASFLAPPPPPPPQHLPPVWNHLGSSLELDPDQRAEVVLDRKIAADDEFVQEDDEELEEEEDYEEDAVGITEEVLAFAMNIAHHPETWLDFPISEEEDFDDFDLSDAQHKHVSVVERLAPRLAALRIELCPAHMSEGYFWMVYFVLLHSRLNKQDGDLLSSPQLVQARTVWMQELHKKSQPESDWYVRSASYSKDSNVSLREDINPTSSEDTYYRNTPHGLFTYEPSTYVLRSEIETEKHPLESPKFIDKSVIEEEPPSQIKEKDIVVAPSYKDLVPEYEDDDDEDDWLQDSSDLEGYSGAANYMGNEEDVSFSDLEDDIDCTMPIKSKVVSDD